MTTHASIPVIYNFAALMNCEFCSGTTDPEYSNEVVKPDYFADCTDYKSFSSRTTSSSNSLLQHRLSYEDEIKNLYSKQECDLSPAAFVIETMTGIGELPVIPVDNAIEQSIEDYFNAKVKPCKKILTQRKD